MFCLFSTITWISTLLLLGLAASSLHAQPIPASHKQGSVHAFLVLKSAEGKVIALGDLVEVAHGAQVRSRLVFHFRDGSIDDERTVFFQRSVLELVSDHHIQKGPSFPKPLDLSFDVSSGLVTTRDVEDGKEDVRTEHINLPDDLSNGMIPLILENIDTKTAETKVSYLTANPKPRILTLAIRPEGVDTFTVAGLKHHANRFKIHIELGGVSGAIAPVIGKQPADIRIWVVGDEVPTFLKMEGAFYQGGPLWKTEPISAVWP